MQTRLSQAGFTITELMFGLAMVGILAALAGPSFNQMMISSRITSSTNNFITAVSYARSEAVKRSAIVRVDAVDDDWGNGWEVVNDADDAVIRSFEAPADTVAIAEASDVVSLRFDGRGLLLGQAGGAVMTVCHSGMNGRQITLSATGRPQLEREYGGC